MGKSNKSEEEEEEQVEVEFNVSMHCNACERKVAKVISKIKGVERFTTDMRNHKVVVMGRFKPEKVLKKLKKKIGKRAEIVIPEVAEEEGEDGEGNKNGKNVLFNREEDNMSLFENVEEEEGGWYNENPFFTMFSDDNANGCSIM